MLHLILGSGGSGKTTAVHQGVANWVKGGGDGSCFLLVPEQYSFETERRMLSLLGPKDSQQVTVTSFRRLTDLVFRQQGRPAGTILTEGGRSVLMSLALEATRDQLTVYQNEKDGSALVKMLLSFEKELKLCGSSGSDFLALREMAGEETLQTKIHDVGLILSAYEALVAQSCLDPLDDLTRILPLIEEGQIFAGATVFLDGFKDFTVQEQGVIGRLLTQAKDVTVALCTDRLRSELGSLFAPTSKAASALIRLARERNVAVETPRVLSPGARFQGAELAFLEQNLFRSVPGQWDGPVTRVQCFAGKNRHDEASFAASEIRRLVMEEGYRYRDFAVIVRDLSAYRGMLEPAFDRYQLSYFLDDPRPVLGEPLIQAVLSAFAVLEDRFDSEDLFTYLKTGMVAGFTRNEISMLENYTYLWSITGKGWLSPWAADPAGFGKGRPEESDDQLELLNDLRERLIAPLRRFERAMEGQTGQGMAGTVYDFLVDIGVDRQVLSLAERLRQMGRYPLAEEQLRLWELLMDVLDQMARLLPDSRLTRRRFGELLQLVLSDAEIAGIPAGLDQVSIGQADRMRPADPKVVFLLGVNQDEFPALAGESGAFTDRERQAMITLGLPLLSTLDELEQDEVYLAYTAAVSGSDRLYLTWCGTDLKGEGKTPSPLIQAVRKILPETAVRARDAMAKEDEARTGETAFTLLAREYRTDSLLSATLTQLFREEPDYTHRLAALDRAASGKGRQFDNPAKARQLFPDTLRLSATQIEAYHQCPFQYFCKYGLRAKEQRPAELSPLEYGNLIHYLLETMFGQVGHAAICQMTDDALREAIRQAIGQFLLEQLGGADDKTPRFLHLFQRMAESATIVIRHIAKELAQSAFQPLGYEMTVDRDGDFPPLTVPLSNGGTAVVGGIIDRVDLYEENGVQYLRVVDYKTGRKKFQLADVVNGVNLQMLLYLAALIETGKYQPAGVLYMPASRPVVSAEKGMGKQEIEKAAEKKLQMNGLLLDDPLILTAMEQDGAGQFIPATIKDGKVRSTATVTKAELDSVLRYMKRTVGEMAQSLHQGQVEASPLQGSYDGCAYCPYFPVCCHEKDDGGRMGLRLDKKEALAAMNPGAGEEEPDYAMDNGTAERH